MKVIVMSDTHGELTRAQNVLQKHQPYNQCFHLGDVGFDASLLQHTCYVRGNHDNHAFVEERMLDIQGWKVWVLHGHTIEYALVEAMQKQSDLWKSWDDCMEIMYKTIFTKAKEKGCNLVLFGHTHTAHFEKRDGIYLCNPGSLCFSHDGKNPSYAVLEIHQSSITCQHYFLSV